MKVNEDKLKSSEENIKLLVEEGFCNEILSKDEFEAMIPKNVKPGRFYLNFKVHKPHLEGSTPPERPIISGCGSLTESLGKYVEHHIKDIANKHDSYLQDTPDFLRTLN